MFKSWKNKVKKGKKNIISNPSPNKKMEDWGPYCDSSA